MSKIGNCDCCDNENVPLFFGIVSGTETYYCEWCAGLGDDVLARVDAALNEEE